MRLMFQGCTPGNDVKTIQSRLNLVAIQVPEQRSKLAALGPDGIFGAKTAKRVVEFQSMNGLTVDGIVGRQTEGKLNDLLGSPTFLTPPHTSPAEKKAAAKSFESSPGTPSQGGLAGGKAGAKSPGMDGFGGSGRKTDAKMG